MQYFQVTFPYLGDEQIPKIFEVGTTWPEQPPPMIFIWDNVCRLVKSWGDMVALWVKTARLLRYPQLLKDNILITKKLQK